jgi:hydrogenase maturation protein HypF
MVRNGPGGVTIEAFAPAGDLEAFLMRLERDPPPAARIVHIRCSEIRPNGSSDFTIEKSDTEGEAAAAIPPDLATCAECLAEIFDPEDRRFGYAFTNCTNCGPRYTIARSVPYDRPATTMARFEMCEACRREYESPGDRRFHAEPNACPACGPKLSLVITQPPAAESKGSSRKEGCGSMIGGKIAHRNVVERAAELLEQGKIVAIKGLGGFHLACDAGSEEAVERLRTKKRREEKPFAIMVRDILDARRLATISERESALLTSAARPIVLVRPRAGNGIASRVAPNNARLGVMLPYTPLHHLLLRAVDRPLVMTSGNISEEPIVWRNEQALERLGPIAEAFVLHDREIEASCDDSVVAVLGEAPVLIRRARGFVPRPLACSHRFERPILACGAQLKNAFAIGAGDSIHVGPHIGDLDNLETYERYAEAIGRLERFLCVRPEIVAHDLHPEYLSTRFALERDAALRIGVQHHHAHIVACMSENGVEGPAFGVAYDGAGHGTDGTVWGGEILLARRSGFARIATFRPILLVGGDRAVRDVWRIALAVLEDAFEGRPPIEAFGLFAGLEPRMVARVRDTLGRRVHCPAARGVGRWFDAIGALVLGRPSARYEGQVAAALEHAADPAELGVYPLAIDRSTSPWMIDPRPLVREVVADLLRRERASIISARFHNTIVRATHDVVTEASAAHGPLPVVFSGGCFQNARLVDGLRRALDGELSTHFHREVPPGDGGIALGQAIVAAAIARGEP